MRNSVVPMVRYVYLGTWRPEIVMNMISYLMTNTSLSTLQVKLMWVGESRAKSNRGEL